MRTGIVRASDLYSYKGRAGRLGIGKTKFNEDYVFHPDCPDEDGFLPGTRVRRLRPVALGVHASGFLSDEVDELIEQLRRERDRTQLRRGARKLAAQALGRYP
jgi:hypothetical protein